MIQIWNLVLDGCPSCGAHLWRYSLGDTCGDPDRRECRNCGRKEKYVCYPPDTTNRWREDT